MRRSLFTAVAASLTGALVIGLLYDLKGAVLTFILLFAVAIVMLSLAHWGVGHRSRLGGLGRQFTLAVLLVSGSIMVSIWLGVWQMFVSSHDAAVVSVMAGLIAVVTLRAGQVLSRGVTGDVEALLDGLERVGEGERNIEVDVGGNDELAQLATAVNSMIERLGAEESKREEADAARRRLVASVSHDLRTPLASLRLLVESIEDGVATGETRDRYIGQLRSHVAVLTGLVDDLFELSRIEAGDITWTMSRIEMDALVGDTVDAMRAQAEVRGVRVLAELPPTSLFVEANPEKVQRVLFNLIQNAIRHTPADGSITVRATALSGEVMIEVADEGSGIPEDDRAHVFEPFFRGGADSSRSTEGAGLGLAVSRAIVEAHGGRIWLEPSHSGTEMRFTLNAAA